MGSQTERSGETWMTVFSKVEQVRRRRNAPLVSIALTISWSGGAGSAEFTVSAKVSLVAPPSVSVTVTVITAVPV